MTMVASYDWESDTWTQHTDEHAARGAWREAVAEIAAKAKQTLPECNGRVDAAVKLVLAGDVEPREDGTTSVASQSNGQVVYHIVNGECTCKDFPKAPSGWCKHRIAAGLYKRVTLLVQRKLTDARNGVSNGQAEVPRQPEPPAPTRLDASLAPLPEAPVSITLKATLHGHEVLVTLRGTDFASVKVQVEQASEWLRVQAPAKSSTQHPTQSGWCAKHGVQMTQNHKNGRSWWSHHTVEGWCKGR